MSAGSVSKSMLLVSDMIESVDAVGIAKTREHLQKLYKDKIKFDDPNVELVIKCVSEITGLPIHEIIKGKGRANERKMAIGFCVYYIHYSFKLTMRDASSIMRTDLTGCYRYCGDVCNLKPGHEADKKYLEWKAQLDPLFPKAIISK